MADATIASDRLARKRVQKREQGHRSRRRKGIPERAPHIPPVIDGANATIHLTRGRVTIVDTVSLPLIAGWKWFLSKRKNGKEYARGCRPGEETYLHRLILGVAKGVEVDHVNGDGLDNRADNLRSATRSQNLANRNKGPRVMSSRFKGVYLRNSKWVAQVKCGANVWSGSFATEIEAARAYNVKAIEAFGEYARLNEIAE